MIRHKEIKETQRQRDRERQRTITQNKERGIEMEMGKRCRPHPDWEKRGKPLQVLTSRSPEGVFLARERLAGWGLP